MAEAPAAMALLNTSRGCTRMVSSVPWEILPTLMSFRRVLTVTT